MPNWCDNSMYLYNADKTKIDALEKELQEKDSEIFKHLRPYKGEWDYMWCVENWGTKWEANVIDYFRDGDNNITVYFETAWGPPITLYEYLESQEWKIEAHYNEPGVCFAGIYSEGFDNHYDYSELSADEIEEELPSELNEIYQISDMKREWEEVNEEEDTEELGEYSQEEVEQALKEIKAEYDKLIAEEDKKEK